MLQHLTRDIQAQILRVDHAAHKTEAVGQQILAVLHNHYTGRIQLQSLLEFLGVEVIRCLRRDVQKRLVRHSALDAGMDDGDGVFVVIELFLIEVVVLLFRDVLLVLLPDGHHGVERLNFPVALVFRLVGILCLFLHTALFHFHLDRVADVVGVLLHQLLQLPRLEEARILLVVGVGLERHDDVRTGSVTLGGLDGITVSAGGRPLPRFVRTVLSRNDRHVLGHHERRVEAHAELANDVNILGLLHVLLELQAAGAADGTEVILHLVAIHADAVVRHRQRPCIRVGFEQNGKVAAVQADLFIRQRQIRQLVNRVGGVGYDFTQENLLMGIDRIDHQIKQALRFRLELLFRHSNTSFQF